MAKLSWPTKGTQWSDFLKSSGLNPETAVRALALGHYAQQYGLPPLYLISGRRTAAWTAAAQQRWDRGDRAGLAVRPATNSSHLSGNAFDTDTQGPEMTAEQWELAGQIGEALGLRWGGRFTTPDPHHFDLP